MPKTEHIKSLLDSLEWQEQWVRECEQATPPDVEELAAAKRLRDATTTALSTIRQHAVEGKNAPLTASDAANCKRQTDVLREVAFHNAGVADLNETAALIKAAKITLAAEGGIISNLHNFVKRNKDWTFIGNRKAWLLEFGPVPPDLLKQEPVPEEPASGLQRHHPTNVVSGP